MRFINNVELLGYLGRDPEFAKNQKGLSICTLSLGTSYDRPLPDGTFDKVTEWSRVVLFKNLADNAAKFLKKGSLVLINGRLQTRKYQNKSNQTCYITEVIANDFIMFGGDQKDNGAKSESSAQCSAILNDMKNNIQDFSFVDTEEMPF